MTILGVALRTPRMADLPLGILTLVLGIVVAYLADSTAVLFGFAGAALATASGVNAREHGLRGMLVVLLFCVTLVAVSAGLFYLIS